jgi:hypothetical protein
MNNWSIYVSYTWLLKSPSNGSKDVRSEGVCNVRVPPYWGVPWLAHQLPVEVVVAATVEAVFVVDVVDDVVDDLEQDARDIDAAMRQLRTK